MIRRSRGPKSCRQNAVDYTHTSPPLIRMANLLECITVNPKQCGARPCVRGMRIRVVDVHDLFAAGLDAAQILDEMPDLEADDLKACLTYARRRMDHPLIAA